MLKRHRIIGIRGVFLGRFDLDALVTGQLLVRLNGRWRFRGRDGRLDCRGHRCFGVRLRREGVCYAFGTAIIVVVTFSMRLVIMMMFIVMVLTVMMLMFVIVMMLVLMIVMVVIVRVELVLMIIVVMMLRIGAIFAVMRMLMMLVMRRGLGVLDDLALDAFAMGAPARAAVPRTAAAGAVLALFLGLAVGAFLGLDQGLAVGDRDLVVVRMDFAEGQEAMAIAAIFDEGCLERWLDPRDLGEIDIAAKLPALGGLEIKLFDAIAADHDDPGLFRVGGIDQHLVGHFGTLGGGGRV